jgi:hypothetical protein
MAEQTQINHAEYQKRIRKFSGDALHYEMKDATADQIGYCWKEINRRETAATDCAILALQACASLDLNASKLRGFPQVWAPFTEPLVLARAALRKAGRVPLSAPA